MDTKIIELFKKHGGEYLSGEDLSHMLKCTRAAVWKHMEKLRDIGYDIEAVPHLGYRLKSVPDKMLPDEIKFELNTKFMGKDIYTYAVTDSTNSLAYKLAEDGAPEGVIVIAEEQRKGKGRLGRRWVSHPGGIYLSCIMKPEIAPGEIQEFTLVSALSVINTLRDTTGLSCLIKWPNDIMLDGKKLCGILTEMKAETDRIDFVILGIGINANVNSKTLPPTATSLKDALNKRVFRIEIVKALLRNLEKEYISFKKDGFTSVRKRIIEKSETIGKNVRVSCHDAIIEGEAVDIDSEGALVIRLKDGTVRKIVSGDISFVYSP